MRWSSLPFGTIDATRSRPLSTEPAATWRTGTDVWVSTEVELLAPWPGEVTTAPAELVLTGEHATLRITADADMPESAALSSSVVTGKPIGMLRPGTQYRLTVWANDFESDVPAFVLPAQAPGWLPHLFDPAASFGLGDAEPSRSDDSEGDLMSRREAVLADVQEHYYARPPRIERGWRHHLVAHDGRVFLDMVNNVTVLGHSHPRVARRSPTSCAPSTPTPGSTTPSIVALAEKLTALLPESLDTVFLVNSGSEAVELALRLARVHTGRDDLSRCGRLPRLDVPGRCGIHLECGQSACSSRRARDGCTPWRRPTPSGAATGESRPATMRRTPPQ